MKWTKLRLDANDTNPIILILAEKYSLIKSTDPILVPAFFSALPVLKQSEMEGIDSKLRSGMSIHDSFIPVKEKFKFSEEKFNNLSKLIESSNTFTQFICIGIMYSIISFDIDDNSPKNNKILTKLLNIFNSHSFVPYHKALGLLFTEIMMNFLEIQDFQWTKEIILSTVKFFAFNKTSNEIPIAIYFQLFNRARKLNDEYVMNNLLEIIMHVIYQNKYNFQKEDLFKIVTDIDPLLKSFNPIAINFFCLLSTNVYMKQIMDSFVTLASVFAARFQASPRFLTKDDFIEHEVPEMHRSEFKFHCCDMNEFDEGFKHIDINLVKSNDNVINFMSNDSFDKLMLLYNSLQMADSDCIVRFLSSLTKLTDVYKNYDFYYDIFLSTMFLISMLLTPDSLRLIQDFFYSKTLFSPGMLAFSKDGLTGVVKYLRTLTINTLIKVDVNFLMDLFASLSIHPLLATEVLIHLTTNEVKLDPYLFANKQFILSMTNIISCLWNSFDENEYVKLAFHTAFSFVYDLLDEKNKLIETCFSSLDFCRTFIGFCNELTLHKNVVLTIRSYLLKVSSETTTSIPAAVNEIYDHCSKHEKISDAEESVILELGDAIIYDFSHNPKLLPCFEPPIDAILQFAAAKPSEEILLQVLRLFSFACQVNRNFKISGKRFCKLIYLMNSIVTADREKMDMKVYSYLINICGGSTVLTTESLFLICFPSFLPVFFAGIENEKVAANYINLLTNLGKYSVSNVKLMHKAGIDTIIIQHLKNPNSKISFRGCSFSLAKIDTEKLFSLLWLITKEVSSNYICLKCLDLMTNPPNIEMASKILAAQVAEVNAMKWNTFSLSDRNPFASLDNVPVTTFNKRFTFCFWIKVDTALQKIQNEQLNILEITNQNNQRFSLRLARGNLYYDFFNNSEDETKNTESTNIGSPSSNDWCFCAFFSKRLSANNNLVGMFINKTLVHCEEAKSMMFDLSLPISYKFGGTNKHSPTEIGALGTFGIASKVFTETELTEIAESNSKVINADREFFFNTNLIRKSKPLPQEKTVIIDNKPYNCVFNNLAKPNLSLHHMLGKGNHMMELVACFDPKLNVPVDFLEISIGLIKLTLADSIEAQKTFCGFPLIGHLLEESKERLTYHLYMAFYSLLEVLSYENCIIDLFDSIIINCNIWMNTKFFERIIGHWGRIITAQYPSMFDRKGVFLSLIECINDPDIELTPHLIRNITNLLLAVASIYISPKEVMQIFGILSNSIEQNNSDVILSMLTLIMNLPRGISKIETKKDNQNILVSLVSHENPEIVVSAIMALDKFSFPEYTNEMIACSFKLAKHPKQAEIFDALYSIADSYNGIFFLCCAYSLSKDEKCLDKCSKMLIALTESTTEKEITNDEFWYIYPLIIALQNEGECRESAVKFIRKFIGTNQQEVQKVVDSAIILAGIMRREATSVSLAILNGMNFVNNKDLALMTFKVMFFIYTDNLLDPVLGLEFINSEFAQYCNSYSFEQFDIASPLLLDEFLQESIKTFFVKFGSSAISEEALLNINQPNVADYQTHQNLFKLLNEISKHKMTPETLLQTDVNEVFHVIKKDIINNASSLATKYHEFIQKSKECIQSSDSNNQQLTASKKAQYVRTSNIEAYRNYITSAHIQDATPSPSSHLGFAMCPYLTYLTIDVNKLFNLSDDDLLNLFDVSYTETSIISLPAKQTVFDQSRNVFVFFGSDKLQVISPRNGPLIVHKEDILFIIQRPPSTIEIFLKDHSSLFIDFSPLKISYVLDDFGKINEELIDQSHGLPHLLKSKKNLSNFEVLIAMSLFSGNTFHVEAKSPKITIGDFVDVPYYDFCCAYRSSFSKIVENRKAIERLKLSSNLMPLIDHQDDIMTIEKEYKVDLDLENEEIRTSLFFNSYFAVFTKDATKVFKLINDEIEFICDHKFILNESCSVGKSQTAAVVKDISQKTTTFINENIKTTEDDEFHEMFAIDNSLQLTVVNKCEVKTGTSNYVFPESIVCIAGSNRGSIFAVGTELCNVFVHSAVKSEFFSMIKLQNEPIKLLVTDIFSIVAIDTEGEVMFYTANGELISVAQMKCVNWCKFDIKGIDFIVLVDSFNKIWLCTAGDTENMKLIGETEDAIESFDVLIQEKLRLCVLTKKGYFYAFPINIVF